MIVHSDFKPLFWLRNPHLQTLWPYLIRRRLKIHVRRERIELPDGDFVDLDWNTCRGGPLVLVLHGLSGSIDSHYAKAVLQALKLRGIRAVLLNFRGSSGEPNRLPRGYHAGETGDLAAVVHVLKEREPATPMAVIGYSLGGNVLLKWLGEQGENAQVCAAVAVCVPFDLHHTTARLMRGFSRLYQWHILRSLKRAVAAKAAVVEVGLDLSALKDATTFRQFDDLITAPLHGFKNAADYYDRCSARAFLGSIRIPTLIIQALDDPFIPPRALPPAAALSPFTTLEIARHGGHVGFIGGRGGLPRYWLEDRILEFLTSRLDMRPAAALPLSTAG